MYCLDYQCFLSMFNIKPLCQRKKAAHIVYCLIFKIATARRPRNDVSIRVSRVLQ